MLFKRVLEGKSALTKNIKVPSEKCKEKQSSCEDCEHSNIFEEIMRILATALGLWALWVGLTYGSTMLPYPLNFIATADVMYPPPQYEYPFPSQMTLSKLPPIKERHLNQSLAFGQSSVEMLRRLEENLEASRIMVEQATPEHGQLIVGYPSDEAMVVQKWSSAITMASFNLAHIYCGKYGVDDEECASYISTFSMRSTDLGDKCTLLNQPTCSSTRIASKYRSFDGSCNNPKRGSLGKAMTGFKRLLHPKYEDGIDEPRRTTHNSVKSLPAARTVSAAMVSDMDVPDSQNTLALMQWTQFVEHDLVHIPVRKMVHTGNSIMCCDRWGRALAPRYQHPSCMALTVSHKDPFYSKHRVTCLPYVRSITTFRSDCTFGAAEQMNQASHFLDGSTIYGSNAKVAASLRQKVGGLMKVQELPHGHFLPVAEKAKERCQVDRDSDVCFVAGDVRVNTHPHLATMHTLWLREHNRIAKGLAELNPTWSDDTLYQEARRIVIAQIQHITYNHWLPALTGKYYDDNLNYYDISYNPDLDPTVTNAFGSAGLRFLSSLMDGTIKLLDEDNNVNATLELTRHFNRPEVVVEPGRLEQLVRSLAEQRSQTMDLHMADDLIEKLYGGKHSLGLDILSLDIQRGRDHGLPPYHQYRAMCGLSPVKDFDDFADVIPQNTIQILKMWYAHPYDVDLIVGAMAEKPKKGAMVGPTFACLLGDQMSRTRSGDRYFYSNIEQPEPFNAQQLTQLRRSSLARLFCDNVPSLHSIQKDVFSIASNRNPLVSCSGNEIKRINLAAWQDPSHKPDLITRTKRHVDKWIKHSKA